MRSERFVDFVFDDEMMGRSSAVVAALLGAVLAAVVEAKAGDIAAAVRLNVANATATGRDIGYSVRCEFTTTLVVRVR